MIVAQDSELLSSHELFLLCSGEGGLQVSSATEGGHENEGQVLGEWLDKSLGAGGGGFADSGM